MRKTVLLLLISIQFIHPIMVQVKAQTEGDTISAVESEYRRLIESYRQKNETYAVSQRQYYGLKTLASQEEAVQVGRDVFLTRADVVIVYLQMLSGLIAERQTIDIQTRTDLSGNIFLMVDELRAHRNRVDIAVDRLKLDEEALWFTNKQKDLLRLSEFAQSLILIGKVEEAADKLVAAKDLIKTDIQTGSMSETKRTQKLRGMEELERTLQVIADSLSQAKVSYAESLTKSSSTTNAGQITEVLNDVYIKILQGVSFAEELTHG